jgi:hypothetical protein
MARFEFSLRIEWWKDEITGERPLLEVCDEMIAKLKDNSQTDSSPGE